MVTGSRKFQSMGCGGCGILFVHWSVTWFGEGAVSSSPRYRTAVRPAGVRIV